MPADLLPKKRKELNKAGDTDWRVGERLPKIYFYRDFRAKAEEIEEQP